MVTAERVTQSEHRHEGHCRVCRADHVVCLGSPDRPTEEQHPREQREEGQDRQDDTGEPVDREPRPSLGGPRVGPARAARSGDALRG